MELSMPIKSADAVIGRWHDIEKTESRSFGRDGSTSHERSFGAREFALPLEQQSGVYKFLENGKMEIRMKGEPATQWNATVAKGFLRLEGPGGTHTYTKEGSEDFYSPGL
jgi:hypothetical protein